jgi:hypothetical protein
LVAVPDEQNMIEVLFENEQEKAGDIEGIKKIQQAGAKIREEISKVIVGSSEVVDQLMLALFARGHCPFGGCAGVGENPDC